MPEPNPSYTIRKNARETLRISVDEFRGRRFLNMRVWYLAEDGEMRPGKGGFAISADHLPELQAILTRLMRGGR